jgi:hypothetical protein
VDVSICSIDDRMIVFARTKVKARCFLRRRAIYAPRDGRSAVDAGGVGALRRTNFIGEDGSGITRIGNPTGDERWCVGQLPLNIGAKTERGRREVALREGPLRRLDDQRGCDGFA